MFWQYPIVLLRKFRRFIRTLCNSAYMFSKNPRSLRYIKPWCMSRRKGHSPLSDQTPWICFPAIRWLESFLHKEMRVFEWGSGGSTLFFATRVRDVVSIEHNADWFRDVREHFCDKSILNVDYRLIEPEAGPPAAVDSADVSCTYGSEFAGYTTNSFVDYVRTIDSEPDSSFEVVMVDGRARMACIVHALDKVKPGGVLILDNSEREQYQKGLMDLQNSSLRHWKRIDLSGPGPFGNFGCWGWGTVAWMRPSNDPM